MTKLKYLIVIILFVSCNSGTKDAIRNRNDRETNDRNYHESASIHVNRRSSSPNCIKMTSKNGVYTIPIKINNQEMEFIFDTGASDILLSTLEAALLIKQGSLTESDILGKETYSMANGDIAVGTVVILRDVQIGSIIIHNIRATVVDNISAPLLCGQSALSKFGRVVINYENETLEFR